MLNFIALGKAVPQCAKQCMRPILSPQLNRLIRRGAGMRRVSFLVSFFIWLLTANAAVALADKASPPTINLATNISSAFSATSAAGEAQNLLPHLQCIFEKMQRDHQVKIMPWRRAYQEVKSNRIDGFFTAIPMRQIDPYAELSAPLVLENWYWFWRSDTIPPESWREGYKLGSILGSQQETWLAEAGYPVEMSANNLPQLIKLLHSKRMDVVLADREHFMAAVKELGMDPSYFQSRFFRYVPLGVYFNEDFLNKNPGFLGSFNRHINQCASARFLLSEHERTLTLELLGRKIERWKRLPAIEPALRAANDRNSQLSQKEMAVRDQRWIQAFIANDYAYPVELINQPLSAELREIKKQAQNMITEVIVTDNRGLNVAISDMTSDYWQGDEEKFSRVIGKPANSIFFSDINYDESTKRFQLHLSVPLHSEKTLTPLGVMIFGVDVENVLSQIQ